jgi:hypothetical protein
LETRLIAPDPVKFITAVGKTVFAAFSGNDFICSQAEADARLAQCRVCPELDTESDQCKLCTCFVKMKVQLATEKCPLNRWTSSLDKPPETGTSL